MIFFNVSLSTLTKTVTDLSKSESVRSNALNQLKEFDKDYYGQFTTATLNADELRAATDRLTQSIIAQAQARGLENRISKITEQIEELTFAQEELAPEFTKTSKNLTNSLDEVSRATFQPGGVGVPFLADLFQLNQVTNQLSEGDTKINTELDKLQKTKDKLEKTLDQIISVGKKGGGGTGKDSSIGQIVEGISGEGVITTNTALFERYIQGQVRINNAGVDAMVRYRREQLNALELMPKKLGKDVGTLGLSLPFGPEAQNNLQQYYNGLFEIEGIYERFKNAQMSGANEFTRLQEQIKSFKGLQSTIENNLTKPFRDFFDELLTNGKVSFDGFVELAKDAFKRILAQAIASGLATLLANILTGGAGGALGQLGAAKGISGILSGLGKTGSLFGAANFSGVGAGPLQMAGAVNLSLRGSDLVGSINRTNATINRVG
jgi:predicted transcriptional regulator